MAWCQLCFERRLEGLEISEELAEHFAHHKGTPPTVGLIKSLNEIQVTQILYFSIYKNGILLISRSIASLRIKPST
jgi:hypothetical protein